ncbi:MAG TPA: hypothetical protein PKM25_11630 [Candidatus Ozemobacteraceae bacterium]|nr:hypothetical protein [Candidatus Ozemobacteraceae bacterium]
MKHRISLLIVFLFLFIPSVHVAAQQSEKIGKVNLGVATSLHPRMSLFDFQHLGFYRVPLGLSPDEFDAAVAKSIASSSPSLSATRIDTLNNQLTEIAKKKQLLFQKLTASERTDKAARQQLEDLDSQARALCDARSELEFSMAHPELTSPDETRKILDEIEHEVTEVLNEVAVERKYDLVLNSTVPVPFGFPLTYRSGSPFGKGVSAVDRQLFYALLAGHDGTMNPQTPDERCFQWLQLTSHPEIQAVLPIKPWPLVIRGGEEFTKEVVERVYARYRVPAEIVAAVSSAIAGFVSADPD